MSTRIEITSRRRRGAGIVSAVAAGVAALALAPAATAAGKNVVGGGETTLAPKKSIAKALSKADVKVRTTKPAQATKQGIVFPVTGKNIAPDGSSGKVTHAGALRLGGGHEELKLSRPLARINDNPKLTVKVGGERIKLFKLGLGKATVSRDGFDTEVRNVKGKLSAVAAKVLRSTYGLPVKRGTTFGKLTIAAEASSVQIADSGATTLALDQGAVDALGSLGIAAAPIDPASAGAGGLAFPITGGKLTLADLSGKVKHSGGIRLSKGATVVDLTSFTIQIDDAPDLTAKLGADRVSILSLDLGGAAVAIDGRRIDVDGVEARLTAGAADALNAAFGTSAFSEGFLLGTASVDAEAR